MQEILVWPQIAQFIPAHASVIDETGILRCVCDVVQGDTIIPVMTGQNIIEGNSMRPNGPSYSIWSQEGDSVESVTLKVLCGIDRYVFGLGRSGQLHAGSGSEAAC